MAEELNEDPQWEITVRVPMRLPVEMRQDLFEGVAKAVSRWEPVQRDGWDADVFGLPTDDRLSYRDSQLLLWLHAEAVWNHHLALLEIARTERAWREIVEVWERGHSENVLPYTMALETEVERLRREVEFEARGASTFSGADAVADGDCVTFVAEDFGLDVDTEAGGIYISLNHRPAARTEEWGEDVSVDYDADGVPTGVEILRSSRSVPQGAVHPTGSGVDLPVEGGGPTP